MQNVSRLYASLSFLVALIAASCGGGAQTAPAAPTNLTAEPLGGGVHLRWQDNSSNEDEFMIMRRLASETAFDTVATVPVNEVQYHDTPLMSGTTYVYVVMATNAAGASESDELTFAAP